MENSLEFQRAETKKKKFKHFFKKGKRKSKSKCLQRD